VNTVAHAHVAMMLAIIALMLRNLVVADIDASSF
jgi:hypothetical protein